MEFTPLPTPPSSSSSSSPSPPLQPGQKPRSASSLAFHRRGAAHALLTTGAQNVIRSQFSISTWLCAGAALQSLLVLLPLPLPAPYRLLPSLALLAYKCAAAGLVLAGWAANPLMDGVVRGRFAALVPRAQGGGFAREVGDSVGGGGVTVFLLGARCNSPLGVLSPNFARLGKYFTAMLGALSREPEKWGFLGSSTYENVSDRTTQPEILYVMYFKSPEHLHAFAAGKVHQEGWDWWMRGGKEKGSGGSGEKGLGDLAISHEMYVVPEAGWENAYHNYAPSGFAATTHLVEEEGGVKRWVSPLVKGDHKGLKSSAGRMGVVKGPTVGGSGMGEKA